MNPNKSIQTAQRIVRNLGVLEYVEKLRYVRSVMKHSASNKRFISANPDFKLPPKALAFDAYSAPAWDFYKTSGEGTAKWLFDTAKQYLKKDSFDNVYEWGCGPARILRHVPTFFGPETEIWGTDYNPDTISWCKSSLPGIHFELNGLNPPLSFEADFFEIIFSVSVFTHLSEAVGHQWIDELYRIARPNGMLVISTNGDSMKPYLSADELATYEANDIVVRGNVEEGKKMFWACHPPSYIREKLFKKFEILDHFPSGFPHVGQDLWIIRKPGN